MRRLEAFSLNSEIEKPCSCSSLRSWICHRDTEANKFIAGKLAFVVTQNPTGRAPNFAKASLGKLSTTTSTSPLTSEIAFSGIRVLTYALMSNHFHLLSEVPQVREPSPRNFCVILGRQKLEAPQLSFGGKCSIRRRTFRWPDQSLRVKPQRALRPKARPQAHEVA